MPPTLKQMTDFFHQVGAESVSHTGKTYLAHAIGVYNDLKRWGADEELCRAGLFHSIYGTERFQMFALPLDRRDELRELIGPRAERLAYLNCAMDRPAFDQLTARGEPPYLFRDRLTGDTIELTEEEYRDLCLLQVCDWLEQAPRSKDWNYRRAAYRRMAEQLGGRAAEAYTQVFAQETPAAR